MEYRMKHNHHIIPRHMGGTDDKSNLILLSIEEHAQAHKDLYEEHGKRQDYVAYRSLLKQMDNEERQEVLSSIGGKGNAGVPKSEAHKAKISAAITGVSKTAEFKANHSKAMKGNSNSKNHSSDEYKAKQAAAMKAAWARRKEKALLNK